MKGHENSPRSNQGRHWKQAAALIAMVLGALPGCTPMSGDGSPANQAQWRKIGGSEVGQTKLTEAEAIRIASNAAVREGRNLANYATPYALYSRTEREDSWAVSFKGKSGRAGDHFVVQVDDRTGWTRYFAGP